MARRGALVGGEVGYCLGIPGNSGYTSGFSGLGIPETPDNYPETPDIVSGESGVKPGVSGGWLPNKSRKNDKNTKLVLLDWLRLYLKRKKCLFLRNVLFAHSRV